VDRALAVASVTGGSTLSLSEDYETKRALNVAQQTVARDRFYKSPLRPKLFAQTFR
jgi:hypothetical protein